MKHVKKIVCGILICMGMLFPLVASAGGVEPGSGGGPGVPLYLRDSSVTDGQTGIQTDVTITLYYSHNVADAAVQKNNRAAISMKSSSGKQIPLTISYSSVFEYRQEIYVKPADDLAAGETYTITISPSMMSRNGYQTGTTDRISFTTREDFVQEEASKKPEDLASKPESEKPFKPEKDTNAKTDQNAVSDQTDEKLQGVTDKKEEQSQKSVAGETDTGSQVQKTDPDTAVEDQKLKEAMEAGIVEETAEKKIEKVSDKKPGKVKTAEENNAEIRQKETAGGYHAFCGCLVLAGCTVVVQILQRRTKEHGRNI